MINAKVRMYLIASIVASLVTAGLVYASGYWMISNNLDGTSTPQATLTLTSNATGKETHLGDFFTLTAHVSDNTKDLVVTFYDNNVNIGMATTDLMGNAILNYQENNPTWNITAKAFHP